MKCLDCGEEFDQRDSVADDRCQDCWESFCDKTWWERFDELAERLRVDTP